MDPPMAPNLGVFRFQKSLKFINGCTFSHDFGLAEFNGALHFVLRHRERLPQSTWKYPPIIAFLGTTAANAPPLVVNAKVVMFVHFVVKAPKFLEMCIFMCSFIWELEPRWKIIHAPLFGGQSPPFLVFIRLLKIYTKLYTRYNKNVQSKVIEH